MLQRLGQDALGKINLAFRECCADFPLKVIAAHFVREPPIGDLHGIAARRELRNLNNFAE
jgi:hypothetical protein